MTVSIIKGAICVLIVLLAANVFGTISSQGQSVPSSEDNIINILGIDPTAYPKIKVNIFIDELCAATGDLVKDDFTVEEDGTRVAIDNFYFTGRASGQKLDLAVVFDETDTMADEIRAMKSNVDDLTNKIKASDIDARYSLVSFENEVMAKIEWTDDPEVFKQEVNQLRAYGGFYKRPEDSLGGVAKALSFGFRPDAQKIIIVITDEPSMQRGDGWSNSTYHQDDVQQELLDAGVMLVAVSPDFRSRSIPSNIPRSDLPLYADMRELAQNSGGLWINIYSADFSVILDQLEEIITGTYVIEYTSPTTTTSGSRTVSVSVNAPGCVEGMASSTYMAPASATVPNQPPVIIGLTSDKSSPQETGSVITWRAEAEDPDGDEVLYRFFVEDEPVTDWTAVNTWVWTAPDEARSYRIEVQVRDGKHAGPRGMDNRKSTSFAISGPNEPPTITTLTADKPSPQEAGSVIRWTAEADDPDGDQVLYRFFLDGEAVTDWTDENVWSWTAPEKAGSYWIEAQVRDGNHAGPTGMDDRKLELLEITETMVVESDILSTEVDPLLKVFGIPSAPKNSVAFSPDGRTLISVGGNNVTLWDVGSGAEIKTWTLDHFKYFNGAYVAFNSDGHILASGDLDGTLKLWDIASGEEIWTMEGHVDRITCVAFSPDGRTLASGSNDGTWKLWDIANGTEIRTWEGQVGYVSIIAFSSDGRILASGGWNDGKLLKLWDAGSGAEIRTLEGQSQSVAWAAFHPDGLTLATGSWDDTLILWDVTSGKKIREEKIIDGIFDAAYSPNGQTLALTGWLGRVILLDVSGNSWRFRTLTGHNGRVDSVAFSPDGRTVASASHDGTVKLWDVANGTEIRTMGIPYHGGVINIALSPDGQILASQRGGFFELWDVTDGRVIRTLEHWSPDDIHFSPDGLYLALKDTGEIKLWDAASGASRFRTLSTRYTITDIIEYITSFAFSSDGHILVSGSSEGTLTLWDVASRKEIRQIINIGTYINDIALSPDGLTLAIWAGGRVGNLELLDIANGTRIRTLGGHSQPVTSFAFSPDGSTLASSAEEDGTMKLWDVSTGTEIWTNDGNFSSNVAFSPDGRTLALGSSDGTVTLWNISNHTKIRTLEGHFGRVTSVEFSSDGYTLASGSIDDTIRLWRVQ